MWEEPWEKSGGKIIKEINLNESPTAKNLSFQIEILTKKTHKNKKYS